MVLFSHADKKGSDGDGEGSTWAQQIFAEEGFRPVNPGVWSQVKQRFAPVTTLFTADDFGGWAKIDKTFFGKGGLWDQLFASTR